MRWDLLGLFLVIASAVAERELPLAEPCDEELCQLPSCRCSSVNIPGNLEQRDTPQFVLLTFDDAVNSINTLTYRSALYGRRNKNSCPAGVTFFVNHEYTDYTLINELYNQGFEIGLHSITHQTPQEYWRDATYEDIVREFGDQIDQMSYFANIPRHSIKGIRSPFLQISGNNSYQMIADVGLVYDLSWPTIKYMDPGLWPYTLDYKSNQDCNIPPCPTASIPNSWVIPMVSWMDVNITACSMVDGCYHIPDRENEEEWFQFIVKNFETHYLGNRAPFGFYVHEWFIRAYPAVERALVRFLDMINTLDDTYMVNANEVIEWVKNPIPQHEYARKSCTTVTPATCEPTSCGSLKAAHTQTTYYMNICTACPRVYPWLGNPLGK